MNAPRVETFRGEALLAHLPAVSRLRAAVFREWPYLYAAEEADEARYMRHYAEDAKAAVVLAFDGAEVVGAATCQPMAHSHPEVRQAFAAHGLDAGRFCYFGESVLLPAYRGQGVGVAFFAAREAHAGSLGLPAAAFCAVVRNPYDPRKPEGYVPLDAFWRKRGYVHQPHLTCGFRWRELGEDRESPHLLSFWMKELR
jgi:GNAT superfamily N-acetyltransferase